jgi:hypothetical protein
VLAHQAEPDQAAPVLPHQRDALQVEVVEQRLAHPLDVAGERVVLPRRRLVGAAEADQVGGDAAQPGVDQDRDHRAVEEAPRWLSVQEEDHLARGRTLVEVVDP